MEENVTPMNVGMKYGVILGLVGVAIGSIMYFTGFSLKSAADPSMGWITSILTNAVVFGFIYMGLKYFRDSNEGQMTFGEGLSSAMFIGLISGLIIAVYNYIFLAFIAPDFMAQVMEISMENQDMTEEQLEATEGMMGAFSSPIFGAFMAFLMRIFGALIWGCLASAILKKEEV